MRRKRQVLALSKTYDEKYEYARKIAKEYYGAENPTDDFIHFLVVLDEIRERMIKEKMKEMEEVEENK